MHSFLAIVLFTTILAHLRIVDQISISVLWFYSVKHAVNETIAVFKVLLGFKMA